MIGSVAAVAAEGRWERHSNQPPTACAKLALTPCVQHIALIEYRTAPPRVWALSGFPSIKSKAIALRVRERGRDRVPRSFRARGDVPSPPTSASLF